MHLDEVLRQTEAHADLSMMRMHNACTVSVVARVLKHDLLRRLLFLALGILATFVGEMACGYGQVVAFTLAFAHKFTP